MPVTRSQKKRNMEKPTEAGVSGGAKKSPSTVRRRGPKEHDKKREVEGDVKPVKEEEDSQDDLDMTDDDDVADGGRIFPDAIVEGSTHDSPVSKKVDAITSQKESKNYTGYDQGTTGKGLTHDKNIYGEKNASKNQVKEPKYVYMLDKYAHYMYRYWYMYILIFLFTLIFISYRYIYTSVTESTEKNHLETAKGQQFLGKMKNLKTDFPSQEEHVWDTIEATAYNHLALKSTPNRPIVLLFGSLRSASKTTECLAKKLGGLLSEALGAFLPLEINGKSYQGHDPHNTKLDIDNRLKEDLNNSKTKAAIVFDLDALPPCSILLFHNYCENDNAQFKDAAFIFTVTLDQGTTGPSGQSKMEEEFWISDHLTRVWSDKCVELPRAKVEAMLSRVANNVGVIKEEQNVVAC